MKRLLYVLCLLAIVSSAATADTNLISNGGFVAPSGTPSFSYKEVTPSSSVQIPGWTVTSGSVDWINTYWQSADGDGYCIDLSGRGNGAIAQQIVGGLEVGGAYELSFWLSGNPDGPPTTKTITLDVTNASGLSQSQFEYVRNGNTKTNMMWQPWTARFVAQEAQIGIAFAGTSGTAYGAALDNVKLQRVVPEPATLLGFGLPMLMVGIGKLKSLKK